MFSAVKFRFGTAGLCPISNLRDYVALQSDDDFMRAIVLLLIMLGSAESSLPPEILHKSGYVNPVRKPTEFTSAMLWGIAIADTRVSGYQHAQVAIARMQLICRVEGADVILNDDSAKLKGGLFRRYPWFGTNASEPMPVAYSPDRDAVILNIGTRPDKVWHFWADSPRAGTPGHLDGCTAKVRAKVSRGALVQIGFDYWRNRTVEYGAGGNNHEAGASNWYFPADRWQEAVFTDVRQ